MHCLPETLSPNQLSDVLNSLPGHVCVKDINGFYIYANQSFADTFGFANPKQIIGKCNHDFLMEESAKIIDDNDRLIIESNIKKDFVETAISKEGKKAVYYSKKSPYLDEQGKVIGLLCVAINIDELDFKINQLEHQADFKSKYINQMKYLDQFAPWFTGTIFWKNRDGAYLGCNENQLCVLKTDMNSIIGKTVFDLLPEDLAREIHEVDEEIMRTGKAQQLQEKMIDNKGRLRVYLSSKMPQTDEAGKVIGLLGVSFDISDRFEMEESLKRAKLAADVANNAKSDFIMNMSHDLRTPFVSIIGFSNVLLQTEQDDKNKEMLSHIFNASNQLLNIIDELIKLASSDDGAVDAHARINLKSITKNLVKLMQPRIDLKNLKIDVNIASDVPQYVVGNKFALRRVMLNLLGNAIKFTEAGFVKLDFEVLEQAQDNKIILRLLIADSGVGIPKAQVKKIFNKFHRASSVRDRFDGTGLGLYFVKLLVEQMQGTIKVDSSYKDGAKFICDIPFAVKF